MKQENPYAAPQASLEPSKSSSELPAVPLPMDFAKGTKTLLLTAWNPLAFVLLNVAFAVHDSLAPITAGLILLTAIRGYLPFCRAETDGKHLFRIATVITAVCFLLFVLTLYGIFSYRESAFRNTLLLWLIGNVLLMLGIGLAAREYRWHSLSKWSNLSCAFSLLLFASVLPLQTKWLGFEVLHTYAAWYYFVGFCFYIANFVTLIQICMTSLEHTERTERLKILRDE